MSRRRRNKTTSEGIGHLSNPSKGDSGEETFVGSPEQVAKSNKHSTTSCRQELNTTGGKV